MSVEHTKPQKEIKINNKYGLYIESECEEDHEFSIVYLTSARFHSFLGVYCKGLPYVREWLEYNDNYVAILHHDLISGAITIKDLIDLEKLKRVSGTPERVRDYYNMFKEANSSINGTLRQEKLNENTSILIENKIIDGFSIDEVELQTVIFRNVCANINIEENEPSEVKGYIGRCDYLGPQVTFDNNGLKGWVEYNRQFVAFVDYDQATNKRRVNRIFDINAKCFLDSETCDLEQIYKQFFAPEFAFKQPIELPVKKLELKNKCKKLILD